MPTNPPTEPKREVDVEVRRAWDDHHRHLLDVSFRILGNLSDAEDAVQEAFARLVRADIEGIDDVGGWLVVVVSRICFDRLRSHRRHPTAPESSLDDGPIDRVLDPADRVTLDDSIRMALHLVLERLSPAERTSFVLHDVFQYPFEAIAEIVGRTPAACRQLASRARRSVTADSGRDRFAVEPADRRRLTDQFIAATTSGDLAGLLAILDPEVSGHAEVGPGIRAGGGVGRDHVARQTLHFLGPATGTTLLAVPAGDHAGILALRDGRLTVLLTLTIRDGFIHHLHVLADPARLAPIAETLGI